MSDPATSPAALPDLASLWNYQDAALSEERFREVVPAARASADRGYLIELLSQLARSLGRQRRFDEADAVLDEADSLLESGMDRPRVRCLLERGRVRNSSGSAARSIPLFREAWELARSAGHDGLAVDAAHMLGIVEEPDVALDWNLRTIGLVEQSGDASVKSWLGPLYNNTGWTYFDRKDYDRALELLRKAEEWYLGHGNPTQIRVARYSVAKTQRLLGRVDEAFSVQRELAGELAATDS
ncbi:MAG: hypothetical protein K0Q72_3073, partial [Armatimonadetes bacterium]|nr:hypothetical protein [Armatimonadota bacterium]